MSQVYLRGLNGLRALAALAVVISHTHLALGEFGLASSGVGGLENSQIASYSVTLFFALSGFLITLLLLIEKDRFGRIDVPAFYWRRALRIWPLYYTYLLLALGAAAFLRLPVEPTSLLWVMFLLPNVPHVLGAPVPYAPHFWSLGVEEQFYLFWPLLLQKAAAPARAIGFFALAYVLLKIVFFWLSWRGAGPFWQTATQLASITRFDCMAVGALGACLFFRGEEAWIKAACSLPAQLAAWAVVALALLNLYRLPPIVDHLAFAVVAVVLIINLSANSRPLVRLEGGTLNFLGRISFGLYIYHPLAISASAMLLEHAPLPHTVKLPLAYGVVILATVGVAACSYQVLEKRFVRLKEKHSRVSSTNLAPSRQP
jgi:peptidoglycan/LPS O-acetylase OafA/YrhL